MQNMDDKWDKSYDNCNQLKLVGPIGRAVVIIVLLKAKLGSQVSSQLRLTLAFHTNVAKTFKENNNLNVFVQMRNVLWVHAGI